MQILDTVERSQVHPLIIIFLIFGVVSMLVGLLSDNNNYGLCQLVAGFIVVALSIAIGFFTEKRTIEYKIFVSDDSIPYSNFCEHWEVLNNDGMIITAKRIDDFPVCEECGEEYYNDWSLYCPNCGEEIK